MYAAILTIRNYLYLALFEKSYSKCLHSLSILRLIPKKRFLNLLCDRGAILRSMLRIINIGIPLANHKRRKITLQTKNPIVLSVIRAIPNCHSRFSLNCSCSFVVDAVGAAPLIDTLRP